jgi:hypothetical protein
MLRADSAKVRWDSGKKRWHVDIQVGAEVIKRHCPKNVPEGNEEALRSLAVETARDEGYDLDSAAVAIVR